ncbi:MAG: amidohydrolase family protein [Bacteroidales bacterium]|nr:amidohydrolase family protein [Bacteroidales bacterium]
MGRYLLENATILTGEYMEEGILSVDGDRIGGIWLKKDLKEGTPSSPIPSEGYERIDLGGKILLAGGIDAHVHFREPGMTGKADFFTESRAALLGGITSVFDMPNTNPPTVSIEAVRDKKSMARGRSWTDYGFHIGATNSNAGIITEALRKGVSGREFAAVKVFMGSSTGNMLVDSESALGEIFSLKDVRILVHCEDEATIRENLRKACEQYGEDIPFTLHPVIRSRKACIRSTAKALETAIAKGTALHVLHVTTAEEAEMIRAAKIHNPLITAETSANYLLFTDADYSSLGAKVKCNPSVKSSRDREALREALRDGVIDTIGSDHAPHLLSEKDAPYRKCPSGVPSIQHSLPAVFTVCMEEDIPLTRIPSLFSEKAASMFGISGKGFLRPGMDADLTVIDKDAIFTVRKEDLAYKCGWSPYEGMTFSAPVQSVFLHGEKVVGDGHITIPSPTGKELLYR